MWGSVCHHVEREASRFHHIYALRRLTTRDLACADVVAVMERHHLVEIRRHWPDHVRKVRVLGVLDDYDPGEPELRDLLTVKVKALLAELSRSTEDRARP